MTCRDCIHFNVCQKPYYGETLACGDVEDRCENFKNKSDHEEVKHARWKLKRRFTSVGGLRYEDRECTNCGIEKTFPVDSENHKCYYCSRCGAKMDGRCITMGKIVDTDVLIQNIASINDLRTLSTKTIGEAIDKTPAVNEWISVEERLPKEGVRVLVYLKEKVGRYTQTDTDRVVNTWVRWRDDVTHWMPLPEPPKEGENDG